MEHQPERRSMFMAEYFTKAVNRRMGAYVIN